MKKEKPGPLITKLVNRNNYKKEKNILFQTPDDLRPELIKRFMGKYLFLLRNITFCQFRLLRFIITKLLIKKTKSIVDEAILTDIDSVTIF